MRIRTSEYPTEAMARAFAQGIEFVNDTACLAHEPRPQEDGTWIVYVHDWAAEMEEDVCPICGAGGELEPRDEEAVDLGGPL
jgi:hypothetical protein